MLMVHRSNSFSYLFRRLSLTLEYLDSKSILKVHLVNQTKLERMSISISSNAWVSCQSIYDKHDMWFSVMQGIDKCLSTDFYSIKSMHNFTSGNLSIYSVN